MTFTAVLALPGFALAPVAQTAPERLELAVELGAHGPSAHSARIVYDGNLGADADDDAAVHRLELFRNTTHRVPRAIPLVRRTGAFYGRIYFP